MVNIIVSLVILLILGFSISRIVKEKRKGAKCIGCPYGGSKSSSCHC